MALGDGRNNAAFAGLIGQFAWCPMADGACRRLRRLTGQGEDLAPLLGAEGGRSPGACGVREQQELNVLHAAARQDEDLGLDLECRSVAAFRTSPTPYGRSRQPDPPYPSVHDH